MRDLREEIANTAKASRWEVCQRFEHDSLRNIAKLPVIGPTEWPDAVVGLRDPVGWIPPYLALMSPKGIRCFCRRFTRSRALAS
jgi:hypothetical protein